MKKITISFLALLLFFCQCKKNETSTDSPIPAINTISSVKLTVAIENLKVLPNQDLKRLAYKLLTPSEKSSLWKYNARIISVNFSKEQKELVNEFTDFLLPEIFNSPPTSVTDNFRDQWLEKAKKLFTSAEITNIAFQVYTSTDQTLLKTSGLKVNDDGGNDCECNINSSFTCSSYSSDAQCWKSYCYAGSGCGFLWAYDCNGDCVLPIKTQQ